MTNRNFGYTIYAYLKQPHTRGRKLDQMAITFVIEFTKSESQDAADLRITIEGFKKEHTAVKAAVAQYRKARREGWKDPQICVKEIDTDVHESHEVLIMHRNCKGIGDSTHDWVFLWDDRKDPRMDLSSIT